MGDEENEKMKSGFNAMVKDLNKNQNGQLIWLSEYTKHADHQNNADISASAGIRKWTDYLQIVE